MLDGSGRCFRSVFVLYKSGSCLKSEYCCYESSLFHYGSLPKITFFKTAVLLKIRIRIPNTGMDLDFEGRQIRIKIRNIGKVPVRHEQSVPWIRIPSVANKFV